MSHSDSQNFQLFCLFMLKSQIVYMFGKAHILRLPISMLETYPDPIILCDLLAYFMSYLKIAKLSCLFIYLYYNFFKFLIIFKIQAIV